MNDIVKRLRKVRAERSLEVDWDAAYEIERLRSALAHCVNVLAEHQRKPGQDLDGFMRGALEAARDALKQPTE